MHPKTIEYQASGASLLKETKDIIIYVLWHLSANPDEVDSSICISISVSRVIFYTLEWELVFLLKFAKGKDFDSSYLMHF